MVVRYYSSTARETSLTNTITNAATNILVGGTVGFPATTPYTLSIDFETDFEELVQVTAAAGNSLTVVRAIDGTSAGGHNAGARVRHVSSARDFADSRSHENADQNVHGLAPGAAIVGTTTTQTLTNKTLASPAFTGSFTGTLRGGGAGADKIRLDNNTDVSLTSTDHAFQVGTDAGANIRMDGNEIMAANNGVMSNLILQAEGGQVTINSGQPADDITQGLFLNGSADINLVNATRASALGTGYQAKADADANYRWSMLVNGKQQWGPGTAGYDVSLERSGFGALSLTGDLFISNNLGVSNIASINTLNVTNLNPGATNIPISSLAVAQTGWTLGGNATLRGGFLSMKINATRTGADITAPASGDITNTGVAQINAIYQPITGFGDIYGSWSNIAGIGAGRIAGASGIIDIMSWVPNQTIQTGQLVSCFYTYPIN